MDERSNTIVMYVSCGRTIGRAVFVFISFNRSIGPIWLRQKSCGHVTLTYLFSAEVTRLERITFFAIFCGFVRNPFETSK